MVHLENLSRYRNSTKIIQIIDSNEYSTLYIPVAKMESQGSEKIFPWKIRSTICSNQGMKTKMLVHELVLKKSAR